MNKIKYLRSKLGLSLRQLSKLSGVGISTLQRLEQGGKSYSKTLGKLSTALGVDLEELEEFETINPKNK